MRIDPPIWLPTNLTIALIERNRNRVVCTPSFADPCAQRLAVAEHGCLFPSLGKVRRDASERVILPPATFPHEPVPADCAPADAAQPASRWIPHRIPAQQSGVEAGWPKSHSRLADVSGMFVDVFA
jgi:hypothetical protein